jgi:allophanate hydrolase subunit 1
MAKDEQETSETTRRRSRARSTGRMGASGIGRGTSSMYRPATSRGWQLSGATL